MLSLLQPLRRSILHALPRSRLLLQPRYAPPLRRFGISTPKFQPLIRRRGYLQLRFPPRPPQPGRPDGSEPGPHAKKDNKRLSAILVLAAGGTVLYYVTHLEQVPETGRWRFMNVSPQEEDQLSEVRHKYIRAEYAPATLPPNHPIVRHVTRVTRRILQSNDLGSLRSDQESRSSPFGLGWFGAPGVDVDSQGKQVGKAYGPAKEWDIIVVNDPKTVNAFVDLGMIVVFTGILPVCRDEQGLAAVLSHEIGHVVARHTAERISSQTISIFFLGILHLFGLDFFVGSAINDYFLQLPNNRTQEKEADVIGMRLMANACYDPAAAPAFHARIGELEAGKGGPLQAFLSTHPSSDVRIEYMQQHLQEAYQILESNPACASLREPFERFLKATLAGERPEGHSFQEIKIR